MSSGVGTMVSYPYANVPARELVGRKAHRARGGRSVDTQRWFAMSAAGPHTEH
ncbi:hypothetical protein [Streptomyces sp. NPDC003327]